jgi:hypothetical protein
MTTRGLIVATAILGAACASGPRPIPPPGADHGDWVDYYRSNYPSNAVLSERSRADPRPWPETFDAQSDPVFAHNEVFVQASPEKVFEVLVDANHWSEFYENARDVKLLPDADGRVPTVLERGTHFSWSTFGTALDTTVTEYEAGRVLGWTCAGGSPVIAAHHRWILVPENGGTRFITEECNHIVISGAIRWALNPIFKASGHGEALPAAHQHWLEELKKRVESAPH